MAHEVRIEAFYGYHTLAVRHAPDHTPRPPKQLFEFAGGRVLLGQQSEWLCGRKKILNTK